MVNGCYWRALPFVVIGRPAIVPVESLETKRKGSRGLAGTGEQPQDSGMVWIRGAAPLHPDKNAADD